jgi:hypothetical protein
VLVEYDVSGTPHYKRAFNTQVLDLIFTLICPLIK